MGLNVAGGDMYPWCDYTWNPLGGKCPNDCGYYMKDIQAPAVREKYSGPQGVMEKEMGVNLKNRSLHRREQLEFANGSPVIFVCSGNDIGVGTGKKALGFSMILLFEVPRFVLPFLPQPRLGIPHVVTLPLGLAVFGVAVGFAGLAALRLGPGVADAPSGDEELQTSCVYGLVRHPIYFGDAFWPVGWSLIFGAAYSLVLAPLWLVLLLVQSFLEEEKLVDEYGEAYERYRENVPYRIIPKVA